MIKKLIDDLEKYRCNFVREADVATIFIEFLYRNQFDSFERSLEEGHVTASCWLLNAAKTHVLLTHHKKLDLWVQLGGHADGERDVRQVALKEAYEESGLKTIELLDEGALFDIDRHAIPARKNEPEHFHYDFRFVLHSTAGDDYIVSEESHDLVWADIARIKDYARDPSVLRMAEKWSQRQS